jgi:MerR family transcriptional regulator, copper efflux regulator
MNVSDIARMVGIAPSAVRFYERKGILPRAPRQPNGYGDYTDDDLSEAADALRADVRSIR